MQFAARLLEVGGAQQAVIAVAFEFVQLVTENVQRGLLALCRLHRHRFFQQGIAQDEQHHQGQDGRGGDEEGK